MGIPVLSTPLKTFKKMNSGHPSIAEIPRVESAAVRRVDYRDGSKYAGQMKNGRRHGEGILFGPDGALRYRGRWKEDLPHGHGTSLHSGGKTYSGEWRFGKPDGTGTLLISPNAHYKGEWKERQIPWARGICFTGSAIQGRLAGGKKRRSRDLPMPKGNLPGPMGKGLFPRSGNAMPFGWFAPV